MESISSTIPFKEYPEIENHYHKKVAKFLSSSHSCEEELWVATEKVHGANFSFVCSGGVGGVGNEIRCCRRNDYLKEEERFFDFQTVRDRYEQQVAMLYKEVKAEFPTLHYIKVFGELYGGIYPGHPATSSPVQSSIFYCPHIDFLAFDLFYKLSDDDSQLYALDYKRACRLFRHCGLHFCEILAEGTVQQLLQLLDAETFESEVYRRHGLERVKGNFVEGYVLKRNQPIYNQYSANLKIKLKNSKHLEAPPAKKKQKKKKEETDKNPEAHFSEQEVIEQCLAYISSSRYDNVVSKLPADQRTSLTVVGMLVLDAWKDFEKAEGQEMLGKAKELKLKILPLMKERAVEMFENRNGQ